MDFYQAMKSRRSRYAITNKSTLTEEQLEELLANAITYTPSAFHSQSSRVVLLLGERHQKLWSIVLETLRRLVPPEKFAPTEEKIASFAAGYGSILYLEDMDTVEALQKKVPSYAENFPIWSMQSAGMLQYAIWTALSQEGLGASLQHYNPLIDEAVHNEFQLPGSWKLLAQMPFGVPTSEPKSLEYKPISDRLRIHK
ncbi:MAG: nitroreductase family protein [Anaerovoracaceae bacterium]